MQQDNTYNHLHSSVIKNPNLVVVSGEKESSIVIMNKIDYQNKNRKIINSGLRVSYTGISKSRAIMKKLCQGQIDLGNFTELQKLIHLKKLRIKRWKT